MVEPVHLASTHYDRPVRQSASQLSTPTIRSYNQKFATRSSRRLILHFIIIRQRTSRPIITHLYSRGTFSIYLNGPDVSARFYYHIRRVSVHLICYDHRNKIYIVKYLYRYAVLVVMCLYTIETIFPSKVALNSHQTYSSTFHPSQPNKNVVHNSLL